MISHLMIVDDDDVDQDLYRRLIERSGIVESLTSFLMAEDALGYLRATDRLPVDVILLDINMPAMDGFQFLDAAVEEFGGQFARAAVVMVTSSLLEEDRHRAEQYDVVKDYINKPLKIEHIQKIDRMLGSK